MIIISIIPKSKGQLKELRKLYPEDHLEYRLDLSDNWDCVDEETVDERVILTIRDESESDCETRQRRSIEKQAKLEHYAKWIKQYGCLVDMELRTYLLLSAREQADLPSEQLILSWHGINKGFDKEEIRSVIKQAELLSCRYIKLAVESSSWHDLDSLTEIINTAKKPLLLAILGSDGLSKRCLYKHIGAEGTYVKSDQTARGQMSVDKAKLLRLGELTGEEKIGGIAGGIQVINSKGLEYYNKIFSDQGMQAVYLPFVIEDFEDFRSWLKVSGLREKFFGISVTMPWKEELSRIGSNRVGSGNLWDGGNEVFNTDIDAFKVIISDILGDKESKKVLILGSGGTAISALEALNGKCETCLSARNFPVGIRLCRKYGSRYVIPENLRGRRFDLLINTTPLGMQGEDVLDFAVGMEFSAAIDLPYNHESTPLGIYCHREGKKYYSGAEFWRYQAEGQKQYFMKKLDKE